MLQALQTLYETFCAIVDIGSDYVISRACFIGETIKTMNLEKFQIMTVMYASRLQETVKKQYLYCYRYNVCFQTTIDRIQYGLYYLGTLFQNRYSVPFCKEWICVSAIWKSYHNYKTPFLHYNDYYESLEKIEDKDEMFKHVYLDLHETFAYEPCFLDGVVSMKMNGLYIHRICHAELDGKTDDIKTELSNVKFLSIEYHSDDYNNPIVLELDRNDYVVGNELLSSGFVYRLLKYQVPFATYDPEYTLSIMDNNIKMFELTAKEYVLLGQSEYVIMKN